MIKYEDGEFLDLMPSFFKDDKDAAAISYAFRMAISSLLAAQKLTHLFSDIDTMPDELLNLMALEMKAPYYSEDMEIETKRKLVMNAMPWRSKAGTKKSVQDLIKTLFGMGNVVEWYEFEDGPGEPGTFDIETDTKLTPELFSQFNKIIESVKNESSHLRQIKTVREINKKLFVASAVSASPRYSIGMIIDGWYEIRMNAFGASVHANNQRVVIK